MKYHYNIDPSTLPLYEMMGTYQLLQWNVDQTVCTVQTIDPSLPWSTSNLKIIGKQKRSKEFNIMNDIP